MGVSGFSAAQGQLEKVSTLKSEIDERKGQTLVDYSNVVSIKFVLPLATDRYFGILISTICIRSKI